MLTHSCVCAWMHYLLFFSRVHYSYPCLTQCNAVFWWLEDVMQVFVIAVPLVILHCTFNSSENVITMLPFPLPYPALFFFFWRGARVRAAPIWMSTTAAENPATRGGGMGWAAVQSRLAGYLMSLVIGSLWPPRIPALLLLMCAGTQRARPIHLSTSIHPCSRSWLEELMLRQKTSSVCSPQPFL